MFLVYKPSDGDEQRLKYNPNKMLSPEMEAIERATGRGWSEFSTAVVEGNALCRRALLWVMLKRQHPTLKFADVSFTWEEVSLEYSRQEYEAMIEHVRTTGSGDDQANAIDRFEAAMVDAIDEEEEAGKARLPIAE